MSDNQQCVHNEGKELFMTEGVKTIIYSVADLARARMSVWIPMATARG